MPFADRRWHESQGSDSWKSFSVTGSTAIRAAPAGSVPSCIFGALRSLETEAGSAAASAGLPCPANCGQKSWRSENTALRTVKTDPDSEKAREGEKAREAEKTKEAEKNRKAETRSIPENYTSPAERPSLAAIPVPDTVGNLGARTLLKG
jgi:hypothetical protein